MKNCFISASAVIALALPLGIGGLTITAPAVAPDAEAYEDFREALRRKAEQIRHELDTCSRDYLWRCHEEIQDRVTGEFADYFSLRALPNGSDGADQPAFEYFRGLHQGGDSGATRLLHSIFTCSHATVQNLQECHPSIRDRVNHDPQWRIYFDAGDLPAGSDGRDLAAYEHFGRLADADDRDRPDLNVISPARRIRNELFPDGEPEPTSERVRGMNREAARRETERRRILERDTVRQKCAELNGRAVFNEDLNTEVCLATPVTDFAYYRTFDNVGRLLPHVRQDIGLQITPVEPLGSLAEIEDIEDHRLVTSDNRAAIIEIHEELGVHAAEIIDLNNSVIINRSAIETLAAGLTDLGEDVVKNTAGVALSLALDTPPLLSDKRYAIGGGVANFRGESGVGFTFSGRLSDNFVGSVGGGLAGSGDSQVGAVKGAVSYQW